MIGMQISKKVEVDVDVSLEDLGTHMAEVGAGDQAAFFDAFAREMDSWTPIDKDSQLLFIARRLTPRAMSVLQTIVNFKEVG